MGKGENAGYQDFPQRFQPCPTQSSIVLYKCFQFGQSEIISFGKALITFIKGIPADTIFRRIKCSKNDYFCFWQDWDTKMLENCEHAGLPVRRITEIPKYHRNTEIPLFLGYLIQISDKYAR